MNCQSIEHIRPAKFSGLSDRELVNYLFSGSVPIDPVSAELLARLSGLLDNIDSLYSSAENGLKKE